MINFIPAVKLAAGLATTFGAGSVVGNIIKASTPENLKLGSKILIGVGGVVLAAAAGDLASRYVENEIDDAVGLVRYAKAKFRADSVKEEPENDVTPGTPEYFEHEGYPAPGAELDEDHQDL